MLPAFKKVTVWHEQRHELVVDFGHARLSQELSVTKLISPRKLHVCFRYIEVSDLGSLLPVKPQVRQQPCQEEWPQHCYGSPAFHPRMTQGLPGQVPPTSVTWPDPASGGQERTVLQDGRKRLGNVCSLAIVMAA